MSSPSIPSSCGLFGSLHGGGKGFPNNCASIKNAERKNELQSYLMSLDRLDRDEDDQDQLFIQLSVDTVYASYVAARNRVQQYTQLLILLKREEDLWAQRVEKARVYWNAATSSTQNSVHQHHPSNGVLRHRMTCKYYQKESKLAAEKRWNHARESTSRNLTSQLNATGSNSVNPLAPIRSVKIHSSKSIAYCIQTEFLPPEPVNQDGTARVSALISPSEDFGVLDTAMEDATEGFSGSGQHPSQRTLMVPRSFDDFLPADEDTNLSDSSGHGPSTLPEIDNPPQHRIQRVLLTLRDSLQMAFTVIGLSRKYPRRPSFEPDKFIPSSLLATTCPMIANVHNTQELDPSHGVSGPPYPFANMTIYRLIMWMNSGSHQKSEAEVLPLVKDVVQAEDFNPKDLDGFSVRRSLRTLDDNGGKGTVTFPDDWQETDITIEIPARSKEDSSRSFTIPGFHYCPLVATIRSVFADIQASAYHLFPFQRVWKDPLDGHQECMFDELYTSDSWLNAQDDLHRQPREPGCSLDRVIAGLSYPIYSRFSSGLRTLRSDPV
ncbi:uncharacterized protein F5891DRAFT_1193506 [Suillus fuscotomentosus]|uniref:Uncharacterized protein n=1 Tax=Suillus fuscotomentosus TaxID=1912939 RepID=A0AAD4DXS2_9AGAM|nr:uncharacterized protein F5891DRAFT_1193506 [Suillus fuscotomentosus]KAG1896064.1 hypothetical protein F5891DRAFT_1193506 [Suillus fuscotomentosus]